MALWSKKKPVLSGTRVMTVAERNRWATKLVAKHFKGGEKAFDEVWKENAGAAYCQMIETLQKANMMGVIPVFHSVYWRALSEDQRDTLGLLFCEMALRCEFRLKELGEDVDAYLARFGIG